MLELCIKCTKMKQPFDNKERERIKINQVNSNKKDVFIFIFFKSLTTIVAPIKHFQKIG